MDGKRISNERAGLLVLATIAVIVVGALSGNWGAAFFVIGVVIGVVTK